MTTEKTELAKRFLVADPPTITDVDTAVINSGAAVLANKMYATIMPHGLRLTFAETNPSSPSPAFRAAVFVSFQVAAALFDLLHRQLSNIEVLSDLPGAEPSGDTK